MADAHCDVFKIKYLIRKAVRSTSKMPLHFMAFAFCFYAYQICYGEETTKELSPTPQYLDDLLSSFKYDKFAQRSAVKAPIDSLKLPEVVMKISNTDLVNASQRKSTVDEMFYYSGTELGDILLRPGQLLNPDQLKYFDGIINLTIKRWKNGVVPYYLSKEYGQNERQFLENEIRKNNEDYARQIVIRPYHDGDTDFVFIFKGGCGCYTNLGNVGGPQAISMNSPCIFNGSISHEMTHTLGIPHASNRLDRNDYITLKHENIPETMKSQYTRYSFKNPANIGKLDYNSKVFYPADTPGFGIPSFDIKQDDIDRSKVGHRDILSDADIERAKQFYSEKNIEKA